MKTLPDCIKVTPNNGPAIATRTYSDEQTYRHRYGIREATDAEVAKMTEAQRWIYQAAGLVPAGVHYGDCIVEGRYVRPLYLQEDGRIDCGNEGSNKALLRPFPLFLAP